MSSARYLVGIDLGTTNSALAYVDLQAEGDLAEQIHVMSIPQLVAAGELSERKLLPSNVYVPGEHELPPGATTLPWGERPTVVGEFAKQQGAKVPGRLVSSAKSWLCHPRVDRLADILPWGAPEGVPKMSPVKASALYLAHLREAWNHRFPKHPLEEQEVVLTVPASFDEVARELTLRAATEAGIGKLILVEEPQAAFYDWTRRHRGRLKEVLGDNRLILVVDVGGGTTDLTLIHCDIEGAAPKLERIAVGDHLLLGGDNMDVALARRVEARLGARLDAAQWSMLVQGCRLAKETVLSPGGPEKTSVSVVGRGARLIGSALSAEISREEVLQVVLDGFFPRTRSDEQPAKGGRTALQELGLPYAAEPAVTRHISAFLRNHAAEVNARDGAAQTLPRPDALLLNGGVFHPIEVGERLVDAVSGWFPDQPKVGLLDAESLDIAVSRGAAYYAMVRRGLGLRIGGGSARAYFVGIDTPDRGRQALCIIPREMEEQEKVDVARPFALTLDRPVSFPLYSTTLARGEKPGDVVPVDEEAFQELPPIQTVLRSGAARDKKAQQPVQIPVRLEAALTEIGTLELWCVATDRDARWKLEFQLRGGPAEETATAVSAMPKRFDEARELIELVYGKKPVRVEKKDVKNLVRNLEKVLGPKEDWTTPVIRELWGALYAGMGKRRRTADHERIWTWLTGFCLRPGFGAPLDAWRASETWKVFEQGLQFQNETANWLAWWILWRRIAGGLEPVAQKRLFDTVAPVLRPPPPGRAAPPRPRGIKAEGVDEMIRMVGSLERLPPEDKVEAGEWFFAKVDASGPQPYLLWAIGRLGARVPFYGSANGCIPVRTAETWIEKLLALPAAENQAFALAQLARVSGDRARDVEASLREKVAQKLVELKATPPTVQMVRELVELAGSEEQRIFGESLPTGLVLLPEGTEPPAS